MSNHRDEEWDELGWMNWPGPDFVLPRGKTDLVSLLRHLDEEEREEIALVVGGDEDSAANGRSLAKAVLASVKKQLALLDSSAFELVVKAAASGGPLGVDIEEMEETICMLRSAGLLFAGIGPKQQAVVVVPDEIRRQWGAYMQGEELREQAARNTTILASCAAVLYYYGIMLEGDLLRIINDLGWKVEAHFLSQLLDWTAGAHDYVYRIDDRWLRHPIVEDELWLQKEQEARAGLNLRPLTAEMLLHLDVDLAGRPSYQVFQRHLEEQGVSSSDVLTMAHMAEAGLKNESPNLAEQLREFALGEDVDDEAYGETERHLDDMRDQTPLWILKGYTPEEVRRQGLEVSTEPLEMPALGGDELFGDDSFLDDDGPLPFGDDLDEDDDAPRPSQPVVRSVKVGRNDPCPCGSGKKYKKCCGR